MKPADSDVADYVDRASALLEIPLDAAHRPGVIENMKRMASLAQLVMAEPFASTDEAAPVFEP